MTNKPHPGCKECWQVFYVYELSTTPASERDQKLSEIEEVLHNMVEMVENGTWDFLPYEHAQVEIGQE